MIFRAKRPPAGKRLLTCERGLTLVEAVAAALLMTVVMVAVLGLYGRTVVYWKRSEAAADMEDHLRITLNTLGSDVRNARALTWLNGPPARIHPGMAAGDLFEVVVPKRTVPWETEIIRYSWAATGTGDTRNILRRKVGSAVPQPIAHHITGIEVDADTGNGLDERGLVLITLRAEKEYRGQLVVAEMTGRFQIRVVD